MREDLKLMGVEEEEAEDKDYWRFILDCMRFMRTCDGRGCHEASAGLHFSDLWGVPLNDDDDVIGPYSLFSAASSTGWYNNFPLRIVH